MIQAADAGIGIVGKVRMSAANLSALFFLGSSYTHMLVQLFACVTSVRAVVCVCLSIFVYACACSMLSLSTNACLSFPPLQEGKQASLASDFSITQFQHVGRLLIWHGRNSYKRSAALSQFVIHRGLIISIMQVQGGKF